MELKFQPENQESIKNYLSKNQVIYNEADLYAFKNINHFAVYNNNNGFSIPEIYFFNKNGQRVLNSADKNECFQIINDISKINSTPYEQNQPSLDSIMKFYTGIHQALDLDKSNKYDAHIFINWAKWAGNLNHTSFEWYQKVREKINQGENIKVYLINQDVQEHWQMTAKQKEQLGI